MTGNTSPRRELTLAAIILGLVLLVALGVSKPALRPATNIATMLLFGGALWLFYRWSFKAPSSSAEGRPG